MELYRAGIDIGSTTVKLVLLNSRNQLVFGKYIRHGARTQQALASLLQDARQAVGDCTLSLYGKTPSYMKNLADIFLKSLSSRLYPRTRQLLLHIFGEIAIHMPLSIMMYFQTLINECIKDLKNSDV